ncbi:hypothetical protein [Kiloniella antarctica]|uniref:Quinohemoprotein amine dehydrogenase alpha subunit haem binding domain-containing protein n=1 Tax=Kiloniella antarctica TaxID=1550907 RepID=A0ABW5BH06_9PROT
MKITTRLVKMTSLLPLTASFILLLATSSNAQEEDEFEGLAPGIGQEEVLIYCSACHSTRIVQQQGMKRSGWEETLEWMVEDQGMSEIDEPDLALILDYLSKHYNVDRPNFPGKK